MSKKQKHLSLLLGGTLLSTCEIYGDISQKTTTTLDEGAYLRTATEVSIQRQATQNTVRETLNTLEPFSHKSDLEKAKFVDVFSAIILSAEKVGDILKVTADNQTPTLVKEISDKIATSLTKILTSDKAEEIWNDSVSVDGPQDHLLYKSAQFKLKTNADLTLPPMNSSDPIASTAALPVQETKPIAKTTPVTQLVYAGQDLSQYPDLVSLSITVAQLRANADITSTKSLDITVTGDAENTSLSTERLAMPNAKIDLSAVTNLSEAIVNHGDTASIKLPASVTTLTIPSTVTVVSGVTGLTSINLTGDAPIPSWATNGDLTAAGATLDLSAMTNLPATLDLSGISSDITGLVINASVEVTAPSDQLTSIKLTGDATSIPSWATDGSLTAAGATLDLSAMTGLGTTVSLSNISSDIVGLVINAGVQPTGINNDRFVSLKLTGNATTIPAWVNDDSMTADTGATLDLFAMAGLGTTFDFSTIANTEIKTLILPAGVTATNTTGWTNTTDTTWTHP